MSTTEETPLSAVSESVTGTNNEVEKMGKTNYVLVIAATFTIISGVILIINYVNNGIEAKSGYPKITIQASNYGWWKEVKFVIEESTVMGRKVYQSRNESLGFNVANRALKTPQAPCSNEGWMAVTAKNIDCIISTTTGSVKCDGKRVSFADGNLCPGGEKQPQIFQVGIPAEKLDAPNLWNIETLRQQLNLTLSNFTLFLETGGKGTKGEDILAPPVTANCVFNVI